MMASSASQSAKAMLSSAAAAPAARKVQKGRGIAGFQPVTTMSSALTACPTKLADMKRATARRMSGTPSNPPSDARIPRACPLAALAGHRLSLVRAPHESSVADMSRPSARAGARRSNVSLFSAKHRPLISSACVPGSARRRAGAHARTSSQHFRRDGSARARSAGDRRWRAGCPRATTAARPCCLTDRVS
jgi:hypothetical protein